MTRMHDLADHLRPQLASELFAPNAAGFEQAHVGFNLAVQHSPDLVVRARTAADVATCVRFAANNGVQVRAQATGHGIGMAMSGGLLVNTSALGAITINPQERTAIVGAGVRWSGVIAAAAPHGLATLCGSSPTVGVVGYSLGGGMGPMGRTFGFQADRVRRVQMVDAAGRLVDIDALREPELFWALRGGKPDVGIVTELEFELVEAPFYYGGGIFYPGANAAQVLHAFADWAPSMPESVSTSIALLRLPDLPEIPPPLRGVLSVHLRFVHIGAQEQGAALLAPMRAVSPVIADLVATQPAAAIPSVHQDPTDPMPAREEGRLLGALPHAAVDALLATAGPEADVPLIIAELRLMGGALARPGEVDSAVGGRDAAFSALVIGPYPPPLQEAVDQSSAAVLDSLAPWSTGSLINFQGCATGVEQVRGAWPVATRQRLDAVKQAYDPQDTFRFSYRA